MEKTSTLKEKEFHELHLLRILVIKKNKILSYKKSDKEWLTNQFEVPTLIISTSDQSLKQYPVLKSQLDLKKLKQFKTSITKYKITNFILEANQKVIKELGFNRELEWKDLEDENSNLSTASSKALKFRV